MGNGETGQCLKEIEALDYTFKKFTINGKKGLKEYLQVVYAESSESTLPVPSKTDNEIMYNAKSKNAMRARVKNVNDKLCEHDYDSFKVAYAALRGYWSDYLKERNESSEFKYLKLHRAFRSLKGNMSNLFWTIEKQSQSTLGTEAQ